MLNKRGKKMVSLEREESGIGGGLLTSTLDDVPDSLLSTRDDQAKS